MRHLDMHFSALALQKRLGRSVRPDDLAEPRIGVEDERVASLARLIAGSARGREPRTLSERADQRAPLSRLRHQGGRRKRRPALSRALLRLATDYIDGTSWSRSGSVTLPISSTSPRASSVMPSRLPPACRHIGGSLNGGLRAPRISCSQESRTSARSRRSAASRTKPFQSRVPDRCWYHPRCLASQRQTRPVTPIAVGSALVDSDKNPNSGQEHAIRSL